jgi:diacylglycerol kinase (ATP)
MTMDVQGGTVRKRALVIYSPTSGRARRLPQALNHLQQAGLQVLRSLPISDLCEQPAQGAHWLEQGVEMVIAAGGDGVVGGTINHIAGSGLPLGILPLGTSNDIARSLGIPLATKAAASVLAAGQTRHTDLGAVYHYNPVHASDALSLADHAPTYGYFAHVLTVGLNVHFAQIATNVATRRRYGRLTYPRAAFEVLRNPRILPVHLQFAGLQFPPHARRSYLARWQHDAAYAELSSRALQITVINAPIFGGAWQMALPGSSMDDSVLDIVVFEEAGLGRLSARLTPCFRLPPLTEDASREHREAERFPPAAVERPGLPGMHHLQARGIVISTACDPQPATLDGEIRAQTPLSVQLLQQCLSVYVPGNTTTSRR